jgi:hypothetical protein
VDFVDSNSGVLVWEYLLHLLGVKHGAQGHPEVIFGDSLLVLPSSVVDFDIFGVIILEELTLEVEVHAEE